MDITPIIFILIMFGPILVDWYRGKIVWNPRQKMLVRKEDQMGKKMIFCYKRINGKETIELDARKENSPARTGERLENNSINKYNISWRDKKCKN